VQKLRTIADLKDAPKSLLREITLIDRIYSLLEDTNVEDIGIRGTFDISSGGRRTGVFHASTVGSKDGKSLCGNYPMGCQRKMYYDVENADNEDHWDPRLRSLLDTGTMIHEQLQAYTHVVADRSGGMETFFDEVDIDPDKNPIAAALDLSGHTDGIYTILTDMYDIRFALEIKSISEKGFKATKSIHSEHAMQGTIYQKCLDVPVMLFVYYNKNTSEMSEFRQVFDPDRWKAIEDKIRYVQECVLDEEPPPHETSWNCRTCKYKRICKPPRAPRAAAARTRFSRGG
jgi:CRISPR/Cas system-associated exonuclease Cas4 (RecB family)